MLSSNKEGAESFSFDRYVDKARFSCYWHQIGEVLALEPKKLLVVGPGDGAVPALIRVYAPHEIEIRTFDFDESLKPDYQGDVREIDRKVPADSFDCILCCQVLEHVPYADFLETLKKMFTVAPNVVMSIPCQYRKLGFSLDIPKIHIKKEAYPDLGKNVLSCKSHFWEAGTGDWPRTRLRRDIGEICTIVKEYRVPEKPLNLFYVLKRK